MTRPTTPPSIERDALVLGAGLRVSFQRTLRIPDDGGDYPLPPGLGRFPLRSVARYAERVPEAWRGHGGVFLPMYQREAMWLSFETRDRVPRALKVGVGKVCALSGEPWSERLHDDPQDYLVTPPQPWIDGIASGHGTVRQFVAMPLGLGYTIEAQVTGHEHVGGLQLAVYEARPGRIPPPPPFVGPRDGVTFLCAGPSAAPSAPCAAASAGMGLGAGGSMRQKLYPDPHGIDVWQARHSARCFVHLATTEQWQDITGEPPPPTPVTAKRYAEEGLPWFDLYDEHAATLAPADTLTAVKSIKHVDAERTDTPQQNDASVTPGPIQQLGAPRSAQAIEDGDW